MLRPVGRKTHRLPLQLGFGVLLPPESMTFSSAKRRRPVTVCGKSHSPFLLIDCLSWSLYFPPPSTNGSPFNERTKGRSETWLHDSEIWLPENHVRSITNFSSSRLYFWDGSQYVRRQRGIAIQKKMVSRGEVKRKEWRALVTKGGI